MCTNGFYLCSPLNIRGKKKTNKLCICILLNLASDWLALASQQGQLFPGYIQTQKQHGDDDMPMRVATITAILSVTHQEGKHKPVLGF